MDQQQEELRKAQEYRRQLLGTVDLGMKWEQFERGELGRYLYACAERDRQGLIEQLIACPPGDVQQNTDVRLELAVIARWKDWISEAVAAGITAQQQFIESDSA